MHSLMKTCVRLAESLAKTVSEADLTNDCAVLDALSDEKTVSEQARLG